MPPGAGVFRSATHPQPQFHPKQVEITRISISNLTFELIAFTFQDTSRSGQKEDGFIKSDNSTSRQCQSHTQAQQHVPLTLQFYTPMLSHYIPSFSPGWFVKTVYSNSIPMAQARIFNFNSEIQAEIHTLHKLRERESKFWISALDVSPKVLQSFIEMMDGAMNEA